MPSPTGPLTAPRLRAAMRIALVLALALCVPLVPFLVIGELPGDRWLSAHDDDAWRFALTGAGLLAADVLIPIPSSLVGTMLGARLGFWSGGAAIFGGLMVGQIGAYAIVRGIARRRADTRAGGAPPLETPTMATLFLSRPVPVLAEALIIAAAYLRMPFPAVLAATASGNLCYALALAANGAALVPQDIVGPGLLLPMLLPVAAWLVWRRMRPTPQS